MINSRRMRWAGCVRRKGQKKNSGCLWRKEKGRYHYEGVGWRIILNWILEVYDKMLLNGFIWLRIMTCIRLL
jgi:hypothetical protein